jgi:hypothetical protein
MEVIMKRVALEMVKRLKVNKPLQQGVEMQYYRAFSFVSIEIKIKCNSAVIKEFFFK